MTYLLLALFFVLLWFTFIGFWQAALIQAVVGILLFARDGKKP